jgi:hypothetical protein
MKGETQMKVTRMMGAALLTLALAVALSACQKKTESTSETTTDQGATVADQAPATDQVTPQTEPPSTPDQGVATTPTTPKPAKKPSSTSKSTKAAYVTDENTMKVPVGTILDVSLVTPVDTRTSNVGDKIEAKLLSPLVINGVTVANQDASLRGEVSALTRASRSKSEEDRASVTFVFSSIETVEGEKALHATVTNSEGKLIAKSTSTRDKLLIGGGAVAGAIVGKVAGKDTKSTVIGALGGAVLGTGAVLASKGHELEVPAGSKVTLRVDEPITVVSK